MFKAKKLQVSDRQRQILERWTRNKADTPYRLVERARIILMSADGKSNATQARELGVDAQRVGRWRSRWFERCAALEAVEQQGVEDKDLANLLQALLSDDYRPGTPSTFTAEQLTTIVAVACELPEECGRPVTHWTPRELADEVMKRGIVQTISIRHIDRFLKKTRSGPTRASIG